MARPRKWGSEAERLAAYRLRTDTPAPCTDTPISVREEGDSVRIGAPVVQSVRAPGFLRFRHQPHVPLSLFDGVGRGSPRPHADGVRYVLVSRHEGPHLGELGVVSAADWQFRLGQRCEHGHAGWACHTC